MDREWRETQRGQAIICSPLLKTSLDRPSSAVGLDWRIRNACTDHKNCIIYQASGMMWSPLDDALEQWGSLVAREEEDAYQMQGDPSPACPATWREKICEWSFQVVDHCDIDRDVVGIAVSYMDRFLSHHTSIPETLFQLVAMTSLYLAVKQHSTRKINVQSMSSLSKGHFRVDQILKMEICIIKTLHWRLNPPTPSLYLNVAKPLIDASAQDINASYQIEDLARYLLELSVCDGFFIDKKPSFVAYAAVLVAMESLPESTKMKGRFDRYQLNKSPYDTQLCVKRIRHVYNLAQSAETKEDERATSSPVSVYQG